MKSVPSVIQTIPHPTGLQTPVFRPFGGYTPSGIRFPYNCNAEPSPPTSRISRHEFLRSVGACLPCTTSADRPAFANCVGGATSRRHTSFYKSITAAFITCMDKEVRTLRTLTVSTGAAGVAAGCAMGGAAPCMPFATTIGTLASVGGFEWAIRHEIVNYDSERSTTSRRNIEVAATAHVAGYRLNPYAAFVAVTCQRWWDNNGNQVYPCS